MKKRSKWFRRLKVAVAVFLLLWPECYLIAVGLGLIKVK